MACATHTITTASSLRGTTSRSLAAATALPGSSDAHAVLGTSIAYADCAAALTAATASNLAAPVASVHPIATALPWQRHSARRPHSRGRSIPRSFDSLPAQLPCAVFRTRSSLTLRYRRCHPHCHSCRQPCSSTVCAALRVAFALCDHLPWHAPPIPSRRLAASEPRPLAPSLLRPPFLAAAMHTLFLGLQSPTQTAPPLSRPRLLLLLLYYSILRFKSGVTYAKSLGPNSCRVHNQTP